MSFSLKKILFVLFVVVAHLVFRKQDYEMGWLGNNRFLSAIEFFILCIDYVFSNLYVSVGTVVFVLLFVRAKTEEEKQRES